MDEATRRAPEETGTESRPVAMGTIGFDFYLAVLGLAPESFRPAALPTF
jgi:hypothetical protein